MEIRLVFGENTRLHTIQQNSYSFIIILYLKNIKFLMQLYIVHLLIKHLKNHQKVRTSSFIVSLKSSTRQSGL